MSLRVDDYSYDLPAELIAQRPLPRREASRMMVLHREEKTIQHRSFTDLAGYIRPGDLLVLNDTRVIRARRFSDDGTIELLLLEQIGERIWRALVRPGRKMRVGASCRVEGVEARVTEICADGSRIVEFSGDLDLARGGAVPLPPYLQRPADEADEDRYQTVYAAAPGAVAAPTAGLHFTPEILASIPHTFVTLHVGQGTFVPVKTENVADHRMHAESYWISPAAADAINAANRIVAVGTTSVRVLESAQRQDGRIMAQQGSTDIFIHPPRRVRFVDVLLTNFHLPRSTLLMLVSAFAGREFVLDAYREAIRERYRFYSYGDCMLIL